VTDPVDEIERVARHALEVSEAVHDSVGVGWAHSHLVIPLLMQGRDEEAEAEARTAVAALEPFGEREEFADALHNLGWYLWRRGRNEEAEPLLRRAIEMAERVDAPLVQVQVMLTLGAA
jgi:tetratricopeptide (TPR) repeat protein